MLAKKITYTDYDGVERTETFYFNLSKSEITEMELIHPGGYSDYLQRIIDAKDQSQIIETFKTIILNSYGEKSEDGKRFRKSEEISNAFYQSEAYSELFMELVQKEGAAAAFINGIMPVDVSKDPELLARTKALTSAQKGDVD